MEETHHTVNIDLRISHYEAPPSVELSEAEAADPRIALVYRLPIIHVEGESHHGYAGDAHVRKVIGSVRMIGDGAVRFSTVRKGTSEL